MGFWGPHMARRASPSDPPRRHLCGISITLLRSARDIHHSFPGVTYAGYPSLFCALCGISVTLFIPFSRNATKPTFFGTFFAKLEYYSVNSKISDLFPLPGAAPGRGRAEVEPRYSSSNSSRSCRSRERSNSNRSSSSSSLREFACDTHVILASGA